nr:MAG TPA: hypothetical protein [Crassvirales sp.]
MVESYKGKTVQAPIEVIVTSAVFLNMKELMATIVALKHTLRIKMVEELREKQMMQRLLLCLLQLCKKEESEED